jgi:hypothetical protein
VTSIFPRMDSIVLRVRDCAAAVDWYRTRLGLRVLYDDATKGVAVLAVGVDDTVTLWQIGPDETMALTDPSRPFPVFEAIDAAAERMQLVARGVRTSNLRAISHNLRCFSFWDLDGNRLDACEVVNLDEPELIGGDRWPA